jgi:hypothetical protein
MLEQRHDKVIIQKWDVSCGAAALASLLTYDLNYPVTERQAAAGMLRFTSVERVRAQLGFSLLDLKRFAESRGFVADGLGNMTLRDLVETGPSIVPIVLHGNNHFVVFRGMQGDRVLLADPAWGNRTMQIPNFMDMWVTRVAFTVSPPGSAPPVHRMMAKSSDFPASSPVFEGQANRLVVASLMDKPPSKAQMIASAAPGEPLSEAAAGPGDGLGHAPRTAAVSAMATASASDAPAADQRLSLPPAQPAGAIDTAPQVMVTATPLPTAAPVAVPLPTAMPVPTRVADVSRPGNEPVAAPVVPQSVEPQGVAAPLITVQASPLPPAPPPPVSRAPGPAQGRADPGGLPARQQAASAARPAAATAASAPVSTDDAWQGTWAVQDTVGVAPLIAVAASPLALPLPPRPPATPAGNVSVSRLDEHAALIAPTAPYGTAGPARPAPAPTVARAVPPAETGRVQAKPVPAIARTAPNRSTAPPVPTSDEQEAVRAAKARMLTAYANAFLVAGDNLLARGDVRGARVLYERAVQAGSARAAAALARTYDPNTLAQFGITDIQPDQATARQWYRTAAALGADTAAASLQELR